MLPSQKLFSEFPDYYPAPEKGEKGTDENIMNAGICK